MQYLPCILLVLFLHNSWWLCHLAFVGFCLFKLGKTFRCVYSWFLQIRMQMLFCYLRHSNSLLCRCATVAKRRTLLTQNSVKFAAVIGRPCFCSSTTVSPNYIFFFFFLIIYAICISGCLFSYRPDCPPTTTHFTICIEASLLFTLSIGRGLIAIPPASLMTMI